MNNKYNKDNLIITALATGNGLRGENNRFITILPSSYHKQELHRGDYLIVEFNQGTLLDGDRNKVNLKQLFCLACVMDTHVDDQWINDYPKNAMFAHTSLDMSDVLAEYGRIYDQF